jgi:hypothetical protein
MAMASRKGIIQALDSPAFNGDVPSFIRAVCKAYSKERDHMPNARLLAKLRISTQTNRSDLLDFLVKRQSDEAMRHVLLRLIGHGDRVPEQAGGFGEVKEEKDPAFIAEEDEEKKTVEALRDLTHLELMLLGVSIPHDATDEQLRAYLLDLTQHGEKLVMTTPIGEAVRDELERSSDRMIQKPAATLLARMQRVLGPDPSKFRMAAVLSATQAATDKVDAEVEALNRAAGDIIQAVEASEDEIQDPKEKKRVRECIAMLKRVRRDAEDEMNRAGAVVAEEYNQSLISELQEKVGRNRKGLMIGAAVTSVLVVALLIFFKSGALKSWNNWSALSVRPTHGYHTTDLQWFCRVYVLWFGSYVDDLFRTANDLVLEELDSSALKSKFTESSFFKDDSRADFLFWMFNKAVLQDLLVPQGKKEILTRLAPRVIQRSKQMYEVNKQSKFPDALSDDHIFPKLDEHGRIHFPTRLSREIPTIRTPLQDVKALHDYFILVLHTWLNLPLAGDATDSPEKTNFRTQWNAKVHTTRSQ